MMYEVATDGEGMPPLTRIHTHTTPYTNTSIKSLLLNITEPYSEIEEAAAVGDAVTAGHRMACPINCPDKLYQLMLQCWDLEPTSRPSFTQIFQQLVAIQTQLSLQPSSPLTSSRTSSPASSPLLSRTQSQSYQHTQQTSQYGVPDLIVEFQQQ